MASWKKNYLNVPTITVTDCDVPVRKSRYPMPVRTCDMDIPGLGTTNKKTVCDTGLRKSKYPMPVRTCDMDLPDITNKKTATPKPFKFQPMRLRDLDLPDNQQTSTRKTPTSKSTNLDNGPKVRRIVRKQLWSDKKTQNRLRIKMKPEKRNTVVGTINLKTVTKLFDGYQSDVKKYEKKTTKDSVENRPTLKELNNKLDKLQEKFDQKFDDLTKIIEKLSKLKCNCQKSDKISTPRLQKITQFELLEQRLAQGSVIASISDPDTPIVIQDIDSLINDKSDIRKSLSTSNLVEKPKKSVRFTSANDIRSRYEEIRSDASFLCTPKNTNKVKNLMTPSVKDNNKKLISRRIQKQLLLLDDH